MWRTLWALKIPASKKNKVFQSLLEISQLWLISYELWVAMTSTVDQKLGNNYFSELFETGTLRTHNDLLIKCWRKSKFVKQILKNQAKLADIDKFYLAVQKCHQNYFIYHGTYCRNISITFTGVYTKPGNKMLYLRDKPFAFVRRTFIDWDQTICK